MSNPDDVLRPRTIDEVRQIISGHETVLPIGNGTKQGCCWSIGNDGDLVRPTVFSMSELSGIVEYQPSEFTFTALAGTSVAKIADVLKEKNQYLPFDPMLIDAGATIGGTIASNAAGSGRFRYGGVRDFLLAVRLFAGDGTSIFVGAKVVKNSAGFDIPKLMVGSLGRLGVLTELTFKVFPIPPNQTTIQVSCHSHEEAIERMSFAASSKWELDSIDYRSADSTIAFKVTGPEQSNQLIANEVLEYFNGDATHVSSLEGDRYWTSVRELKFAPPEAVIIRVPTTTSTFLELVREIEDDPNVDMHLSCAGSLTLLALKFPGAITRMDEVFRKLALSGLVFRGLATTTWLGERNARAIDDAIKQAMDPTNKFPDL